MRLDGKKVVVLGGSSGIGLATARAAAGDGASVIIASSRQSRIDEALASLPSSAQGHALDLTDEASVKDLFAAIGPFDHLVFTAADALVVGALADTAIADAQRFFALRFWGAVTATKVASPCILPGGSITLTSGIAGHRPQSGWSIGASICTAMEGLTRALAVELAPIRVNAVSPGLVKTPIWDGLSEADRESMYLRTAERLPVGHAGEADELAQTYVHLMRQSYGTGQILVVDGGATLV